MEQTCPTCGKGVGCGRPDEGRATCFPFCSERCRLVDLGAWLDCAYVIHSSTEAGQTEDAMGPGGGTGN